jgi:hypothetical protein
MKSLLIIIPYFGKWPEWFPIYLESCRQNPTINWLFHTDCYFDSSDIPNIRVKLTTKEDFIKHVNEKLGVRFVLNDPYKLVDLKPMTAVLYEEEIRGYDFWGYGDIDLLYGNIRKFYTDKVLENNIISTHTWCISGHLALIKNKGYLNNAFRRIKNWKKLIENPDSVRFDEDIFTKVFRYPGWLPTTFFFLYDLINPFSKKYRKKLFFHEQWTTPLTPVKWRNGSHDHPQVWFWKNGCITNELDKGIEHIYFHFMNYKYPRYVNPAYMNTMFWKDREKVIHIKPDEISQGVKIDRSGFHAINNM